MHFRKFSPIDRDHPIFELVDGDEILFDVSLGDHGRLQVAFHEAIGNRVLECGTLLSILREGARLATDEVVSRKA